MNSKWTKDLNARSNFETTREKLRETHEDIGNNFLNRTLIVQDTRARIYKKGFYQIKKLLRSKGNNYQNQETTYTMGENICQILDKGLIPRSYKEL
jgi:hypothetical protein